MVLGMLEFCRDVGVEKTVSFGGGSTGRVGVEAQFLLDSLLAPLEEPLLLATGGLPRTASERLGAAVKGLRSVFEHVVIVFHGLNLLAAEQDSSEPLHSKCDTMWTAPPGKAAAECAALSSLLWSDRRFVRALMCELRTSLGVDCVVAPYKAWAQLGYFAQTGQVDYVIGSGTNLLYGEGHVKLVTSMDLGKGECTYLDGATIHAALGVTSMQLLDACVMAGVSLHKARVLEHHVASRTFALCLQDAKSKAGPIGVTAELIALRHMCVLYQPCRVEPLDAAHAPVDLYSVFGPRFPDLVYFFLVEGGLCPSVLDALLSGRIFDGPPRVDSGTYRLVLNQLIGLRSLTYGLLTEGLHPSFARTRIVMVRWYDPHQEYVFRMRLGQTMLKYRQWKDSAESPRVAGPLDMAFVLSALSKPDKLAKHNRSLLRSKCETEDEFLFQVLAEGMRLTGFASADETPLLPPSHTEAALLAFFALRIGSLHGESMELSPDLELASLPLPNVNSVLLSRFFSLLDPVSLNGAAWSGPVDLDLCAFGCVAERVCESLRNLLDVVALRLWLDKMVSAPVESITRVFAELPFAIGPHFGVGLLMKRILLNPNLYTVERAKAEFPNLTDPLREARRAAEFLESCHATLEQSKKGVNALGPAYWYFQQVKQQSSFYRL